MCAPGRPISLMDAMMLVGKILVLEMFGNSRSHLFGDEVAPRVPNLDSVPSEKGIQDGRAFIEGETRLWLTLIFHGSWLNWRRFSLWW